MIRRFAFAPILLAASLSTPAMAACLPEGTLPGKLTFDSGAMVEVLGREGETLRYRQTIAENGRVVEMTVHAGIFTVSALRDGEGAVFDWKEALPTLAELVPGAAFTREAILTTPGFLPPRPFTTEVEIIGMEEITVAGCAMQALKMVVKNNEAGKDLGEITKWVDLATLLTLKSEVREGDAMRAQEVVAME
jgi:hypothetical protein